jgi:hypothetical protein
MDQVFFLDSHITAHILTGGSKAQHLEQRQWLLAADNIVLCLETFQGN